MNTTGQFKDVRFMTAAEKQKVLGHWVKFLEGDLAPRLFTKSLYEHLINHASFIAHFSAGGFIETYFTDPTDTQRFLDQFDRAKGCRSIEYGDTGWIDTEDYRDINGAMVDEATGRLPELRRMLRNREVAKARQELGQAERRLKQILSASETESTAQRGGA